MIRFLADALRFYFEFHARYDGFYGAFVHDPLVVAAALDPGLVDGRARGRRGRRVRWPGRRPDDRGLATRARPDPERRRGRRGRRRRVRAPARRAGRGPRRGSRPRRIGPAATRADGSPTDGGL